MADLFDKTTPLNKNLTLITSKNVAKIRSPKVILKCENEGTIQEGHAMPNEGVGQAINPRGDYHLDHFVTRPSRETDNGTAIRSGDISEETAPDGFVEQVLATARRLVSDEQPPQEARTFILYGERGIGKTWMCQHLHRDVLSSFSEMLSLLLRFCPCSDKTTHDTREHRLDMTEASVDDDYFHTVQDILLWIVDQLQIRASLVEARIADEEDYLIREITRHLITTKQRLTLFLDSIFEQDWKLLERLEAFLLAPLAQVPTTLIVMTGRGRLFPWESPDLRVNVIYRRLRPFESDEIQTQLHKLGKYVDLNDCDEIKALGGGIPLSNAILADRPRDLTKLVREIMANVKPRVREYIEAMCVLEEGFREDEIPHLLSARQANSAEAQKITEWSLMQIREARDEMADTHLVAWSEGRYMVDAGACAAIRSWLKRDQPDLWHKLLEATKNMYLHWAEKYRLKYPKSADHYAKQALRYASETEHFVNV